MIFLKRIRLIVAFSYLIISLISYYILFRLLKLFRLNNPVFNYHLFRVMPRVMLLLCGIKLIYHNKEALYKHKFMQTNHIYAFNHASFFDYLIIYSVIPVYFQPIVYDGAFKFPLFGLLMREVGSIPAIRTLVKDRIEQNLNDMAASLKKGSIVIFPEGKLTHDGKMQEMRRGIYEIARRSGQPVMPIIIQGSFDIFPRPKHKIVGKGLWFFSYALFWLGSMFVNFRDKTVKIYIEPPITISEGENAEEFLRRLKEKYISVLGA
jgi:1-acyl-sn-glycerol-3-phosphate acyltransferase